MSFLNSHSLHSILNNTIQFIHSILILKQHPSTHIHIVFNKHSNPTILLKPFFLPCSSHFIATTYNAIFFPPPVIFLITKQLAPILLKSTLNFIFLPSKDVMDLWLFYSPVISTFTVIYQQSQSFVINTQYVSIDHHVGSTSLLHDAYRHIARFDLPQYQAAQSLHCCLFPTVDILFLSKLS